MNRMSFPVFMSMLLLGIGTLVMTIRDIQALAADPPTEHSNQGSMTDDHFRIKVVDAAGAIILDHEVHAQQIVDDECVIGANRPYTLVSVTERKPGTNMIIRESMVRVVIPHPEPQVGWCDHFISRDCCAGITDGMRICDHLMLVTLQTRYFFEWIWPVLQTRFCMVDGIVDSCLRVIDCNGNEQWITPCFGNGDGPFPMMVSTPCDQCVIGFPQDEDGSFIYEAACSHGADGICPDA